MTREAPLDPIEDLARDAADAVGPGWDNEPEEWREVYRKIARLSLAAMQRRGFGPGAVTRNERVNTITDLRAAIEYALGGSFANDEDRVAWLRVWSAGDRMRMDVENEG